jgi:hypothetical protein
MIPLGTTLAAIGAAVMMLAVAEILLARWVGPIPVPVRTLDPLLDQDD